MIWSSKQLLESYLCDHTDQLSLWGMARLFQEVAEHHTHVTHIGWLDLIEQNKAWVLTRIHYEINKMPTLFSEMTIQTWSRGVDGLYAVRDFQILNSNGDKLCAATAYWVVIDFSSRRAIRLAGLMDDYEHHSMQATSAATLVKQRFSVTDDADFTCQFTATDSMLDHTKHVNNAEYLRWISDNMPQEILNAPSRYNGYSIDIDYLQESRPNEAITLHRSTKEDAILFEIATPRATAAKAKVEKKVTSLSSKPR